MSERSVARDPQPVAITVPSFLSQDASNSSRDSLRCSADSAPLSALSGVEGRHLFLVLLVSIALAWPAAASAQGRVECRSVPSATLKRAVQYCALLPPSYDTEKMRRYPVLYYFHGLGDNEQSLVNLGGWNLIEKLWASSRIGEFLIVTPNGGRGFYVNSQDGRQRYEDFLLQEFFPAIEKSYRVRAGRASRGIGGTSMGGYGALRLAFLHPELFVSVTAHSPLLVESLPAGRSDPRAGWAQDSVLAGVFGRPVDLAHWERNNPLAIARRAAGLARLKIYFDCGRDDDYGFERGAEMLAKVLKFRGIAHQAHIYPGRHDWFYVGEHLDESLEFHSRAFGLKKE